MLDTQFLNEKATKFRSALKKVKQIIDRGPEEFINTPMYPDRVQYYMIIAYDELDQIACHLIKEISGAKKKENCVDDLVSQDIFSGKVSRGLQDFKKFRDSIFETRFKYSPEQMYVSVKNILDNLFDNFISELAQLVKELKSKEPELSIPVNLKKVNEQAKAVKSSIKKIKIFLGYPFDEFKENPMFMDRTRYFLVVAVDSSLWICRHILRKLKSKHKNCFDGLFREGVISQKTADSLNKLLSLRDDLANPETDIPAEELFKTASESIQVFENYIKEISRAIIGKSDT
ncbi:DUF86 domain-containing protein [Persephonella sp.]